MAKWRPLHQNITRSDKMLSLANNGDYFAMNLYQNLLPYTDRAGRLNAHPLALLGSIFEGYPYTAEQIEAGLDALNRVGLIIRYHTDRQRYLVEYTNFEAMNVFDKREAKSQLPGPSDEGSTIVPPDPTGSTENPKETTGAAQEVPGSPRPLHVHVHGDTTSTSTPTEHTLSEAETNPPASELVEAQPRQDAQPPPTSPNGKAKTRGDPTVRAIDQPYVDAWNDNRGPLPRILTVGRERERALDRLRRELGDEALELFRDATRQVAMERSYRERGYGIGHLLSGGGDGKVLKWAEKYRANRGLTDADRRLADKAAKVADAIGGIP